MPISVKGDVFIGLGNGFDLMLDDEKRISAVKKCSDGVIIGIPLCKATDESIEAFKGFLDQLRVFAWWVYRSHVRCLIYGSKDKLEAFIIAQQLILNNPALSEFKDVLRRYTINRENSTYHVLDLIGIDWKWYPSFDNVIAWMTMLKDTKSFGVYYEFIRIGEENNDVEEHASDHSEDFLSTSTHTVVIEDFDIAEELPLNL